MKRATKLALAFSVVTLLASTHSEAKVWRVNNIPAVSADFKDFNTAANSPLVNPGDTIYLEGSASSYTPFMLRKKLVVFGTGYLLTGPTGNPGLQFNTNHTRVNSLQIDSLATGSAFYGVSGTIYINSNVDSISFIRCDINLQQNSNFANSRIAGLVVNKCMGSISLSTYLVQEPVITNCIFTGSVYIDNVINGLFRNNVALSSATLSNFYITNNYFQSSVNYTSSTIKHNFALNINTFPAGNNNQNGITAAAMFVNTGSNDAKYQLRPGSPGIGAGEPILGVTPDIGAFGTADPYRLSGIPPIPTIYALTVPASIPASATALDITISTRSNN